MESMTLDLKGVPTVPLSGELTLGLTGDLIYLRPMSRTLEYQRADLVKEMRRADVLIGNLETVLLDPDSFRGSPQAESGGTWMLADPQVAEDLRTLGFSILGLANNHATDWGVEGLLDTRELLNEAGLLHAGAGRTMAEARSACYADMPQGRVGFLSASATFTAMSPAADPYGHVPGRPGISVLRRREYSAVHPDDYELLVSLAEEKSLSNAVRQDSLKLMGGEFSADESVPVGTAQVRYRPDLDDAGAILGQIRQAKQNSNLVVFALHSHEPDNSVTTPAAFAADFNRQAVEAGADVVVSHGPHQLRGIELYRGRPIFHSLGNFAMMTNSLDTVTRETYELYDLDPRKVTVPELLTARNVAVFGDPNMNESVLPLLRYRDGRLAEIELVPLDLAPGQGAVFGTPAKMEGVRGHRCLERLAKLSEPFGTVFDIGEDRACVRLG